MQIDFESNIKWNSHSKNFSQVVFRRSVGHDVHDGHQLPEADGAVPVLVVHVEDTLGQLVAVAAGVTFCEEGPEQKKLRLYTFERKNILKGFFDSSWKCSTSATISLQIFGFDLDLQMKPKNLHFDNTQLLKTKMI